MEEHNMSCWFSLEDRKMWVTGGRIRGEKNGRKPS